MSDLEKRTFGGTGLSVSVLGFGAMDLGGPPITNEISDAESDKVLNSVLDAGINFIDTAVCYGTSEARIGRAISHRRSEFILATKCGCVPGAGIGKPHIHTGENIRADMEHSLRTMRTDYLDIVQIHRSLTRSAWEAEGTMDELQKMKQEGKIRFIGISGVLPELPEQIAAGVFDAFQIPYSALQREHETVIDQASTAGGGIIIRGGVARGAPIDWNKSYYMVGREDLIARWNDARLDDLLDEMSRIEFMVRYVISLPATDTTIIGTKNLDHLAENLTAARKGPLAANIVAEVNLRLDATKSRPSEH